MNDYFAQKTAVITGAASGIGLALVEMLLERQAKAVIMADINQDNLQQHSNRLSEKYPGKVLGVKTDVTSEDEVRNLIDKAAVFTGNHIDFLFNNAGLSLAKFFDDTTFEDWEKGFAINFYSALYGIRAVLPIMRAQGSGYIANTASGIAFTPMPMQSMYSATKSALMALGSTLRSELWEENIHVSTIIPGTVATSIWQGKTPPDAITPEESARGILAGIEKNHRIIVVTDTDREGAKNFYNAIDSAGFDEYIAGVARKRRAGIYNEY